MAELLHPDAKHEGLTPSSPALQKKQRYNLLATIISGFIVGGGLMVFAYMIGPQREQYPFTYLVCISGYILGWITALICTPMNQSDEDKIGRFTKVVGTFLSGYLLSKCDKIFEKLFDPGHLVASINGERLLLFLCCFGLTFILVFYYRRYKWHVS
jgi:uncharacterized membrane protein